MKEPTVKTLSITAIKPYWRNPRDNHAAVEKVKKSIEQYGYNQLIGVDKKNVIIAGHTRYLALQELGWKKVQVMVLDLTEKQAKAYRIVDNKTAEFATWTPELANELRELEDLGSMQPFFEDNLEQMIAASAGKDAGLVTAREVATVGKNLTDRFGHGSETYKNQEKQVTCPDCGHEFLIRA